MKKTIYFFICISVISFFFYGNTVAQNVSDNKTKSAWTANNPFHTDVFVENLGQFNSWVNTTDPIKYAVNNSDKIFFTPHGLIFKLEKIKKKEMSEEEREEMEKSKSKEPVISENNIFCVSMQWEGCNADVVMEAIDESEGYYTFGEKGYEDVKAKGHKKLLYKNLYNGIDAEYTIPEKGGIKYSLIIHPGADISQVKMKYSGDIRKIKTDKKGNIQIETPAGEITDHAPESYYNEDKVEIPSVFSLEGNIVSFQLPTSNLPGGQAGSQLSTIIIDPWTITPTSLVTDNAALDTYFDNNGNAYVSGGTQPFKLAKYPPSGGAPLWTFTNPPVWGQCLSSYWAYSRFCVLPSGTVFIGEGYEPGGARVMKINTAGVVVYTTPQLVGNEEIWEMFYNPCTGQLIGFGGGTQSPNNFQQIADTMLTSSAAHCFNSYFTPQNDVTAVQMDYNGDFFALLSSNGGNGSDDHIQKSLISNNYNPPTAFDVSSGYDFSEIDNYGIPSFSWPLLIQTVRANALALNSTYLFSYDGKTVKAWDKTNGTLLGSVVVLPLYPEGQYRAHEGIAVDECNNVYVGGSNMVHVYSFNAGSFTPQTPINTTGPVYDVQLSRTTNTLYICGLGFVTVMPATNTCTINPLVITDSIDQCSGDVFIYVTGGTPPYTYLWNTGDTTNTLTGLANGIYTVTVTDNNCIPFSKTDTITIDHALTLSISFTNSTCGLADGSASVSVTTGTMPYTYLWDVIPVQTTPTLQNVPAGTYSVTVTDSLGCSATASTIITTSTLPATIAGIIDATCNQSDGSASVNVTGGTPPYTYLWDTSPVQTIQTIQNVPAGTYSVTVTDDIGCTATVTGIISTTPLPATIAGVIDATCNQSNGSAGVNVTGGTPPYTYLWDTSPAQMTQTIQNVPAGTYSVTVTDDMGCTATATGIISNTPLPATIANVVNASCNQSNGSAGVNVSGGTLPYSYIWDTNPAQTTQTIVNVPAGTYNVTVTDAIGCTATTQVTITDTPIPTLPAPPDITVCNGATVPASAFVSTPAGASFAWTSSNTTIGLSASGVGNTPSFTATNTGSAAITSTISVTPTLSGCNGTTVTYTITVNPTPTVTNSPLTQSICSGSGTSLVTLTSNVSGATFTWTATATGGITGFTASGTSTIPVQTLINPGTFPGTVTYTITPTANGCAGPVTNYIITVNYIPTSTFTATPITCAGNPSTINYTGTGNSSGNFVWTWDGGTAVPGTGIGPHSVSWLSSGPHPITLTVTLNGCTSSPTTVSVTNPTPLISTITHTDLLCNGELNGTVDLTVSGGTPPYNYQWSNLANTEDLSGIGAGVYSVVVTDFNGCTTTNGTTVLEPPELHVGINPVNICYNQSTDLIVSVTGGTYGYTYLWSNGSTGDSITVTLLTATIYSVSVTDQNGCTANISVTINVSSLIDVTLMANTDSVCPGETVMLTPVITGGAPPYTIIDQDGTIVTPPVYIYPEASGYYSVYVEDTCGTHDTGYAYIHVFPFPPIGVLADPAGCQPFTVHFYEVYPDSGCTFVWDFGDNENLSLAHDPVHTYTDPGVYTVTLTVTSQWGCETFMQYTDMITVYPKPHAQFTWSPEFASILDPVISFNNMSVNASSYIWIFGDGDSTSIVNPVHYFHDAGSWNVQLIAISNMGCRDTAICPVVIQDEWTFYVPTAFSPDNDQINDFFFAFAHGIRETGFYLAVYDRWGEVIWETDKYSEITDQSEKWDGRAKDHEVVPVGTYIWVAKFKDFNGNAHEKAGAVTVIR